MKRFLDLADFSRDEVLSLLELARRLEKTPEPHALAQGRGCRHRIGPWGGPPGLPV